MVPGSAEVADVVEHAVQWTWDGDGIVTAVLDDPGRRVNTVNRRYHDGMAALLADLTDNLDRLRGVVLTSAKASFFTGDEVGPADMSAEDMAAAYELAAPVKDQLRRLETLGRPVVAALNGSALGFGLEIGLASHWRIGLDAPGVVYGSPEVTMGILPGAGGLVRLTRLLGVERGFLEVFGSGHPQPTRQALALGVLDEATPDRATQLAAARAWLLAQPAEPAVQRWERPGHRIPGGVKGSPELDLVASALRARVAAAAVNTAQTAAATVLETAIDTTGLPLDDALALETDRQHGLFANPLTPVLGTFVFGTVRGLRDGARRPAGPPTGVQRLAVVGASRLASALRARAVQHAIDTTTDSAATGTDLVLDARDPLDQAPLAAAGPVLRVVEPGAERSAPGMRVVVDSRPGQTVVEVHDGDDASRRVAFDAVRALGFVPVLSSGASTVFDTLRQAFTDEVHALQQEGTPLEDIAASVASVGFASTPLAGESAGSALLGRAQAADQSAGVRLLDAVAQAASALVAAGASSPEQVDVASRGAVGYPDWTGGAATRGASLRTDPAA